MHVLIEARTLGSKPSGVGIYLYNMIKALLERNVELSLITDLIESDEMKELKADDRVTVYSYQKHTSKSAGVIVYAKYVQKIIHQCKPDIFWAGNNLMPIRIKNPYGKYIITIHDMFPMYMKEEYGFLYRMYFRYGIHKTISCVDSIVYNSEDTKKETEFYFKKAQQVNSYVGYLIVKPIIPDNICDKGYFLYIGNLERRKGTDLLLKAYKNYRESGGTIDLYLAGKFRERTIENLYEDISSQIDGIQYKGYVSEKEKEILLSECSAFVFPSRAEGFGIPVIEALSCEKPVLLTELSVYEELISESIDKVSLKNDEDIIIEDIVSQLMDYQEYQLTDSRKYVRRFSSEHIGDKFYDFFKGLVD